MVGRRSRQIAFAAALAVCAFAVDAAMGRLPFGLEQVDMYGPAGGFSVG